MLALWTSLSGLYVNRACISQREYSSKDASIGLSVACVTLLWGSQQVNTMLRAQSEFPLRVFLRFLFMGKYKVHVWKFGTLWIWLFCGNISLMFKQLASNRAFHILYLMSYKLPRHYLALQYIYIFFECPHLNLAGIFMYLLDVHHLLKST